MHYLEVALVYTGDAIFKMLLEYDFDLHRGEETVVQYLERHFQSYLNDLVSASQGENPLLEQRFCKKLRKRIKKIRSFCKDIVDVEQAYRNGNIKEAYAIGEQLFNRMQPYFIPRYSWAGNDGVFYRIREGDHRAPAGGDSRKAKSELFHIRDAKRSKISAHRYSVSGYPCLYLANGFELCWFESGVPKKFSYCEMSIAETGDKALRLIDFGNRPIDLLSKIFVWLSNAQRHDNKKEKKKILDYLLNYITIYPLAAGEPAKIKDNLLRWKGRTEDPEIGGKKWERSGRNTTKISRRMRSSYRMQVRRQ